MNSNKRKHWFGRSLHWTCRWLATCGALILIAITIVTVTSVLGRFFFGRPIDGDFELVELGSAIAVSMFLPYCQLKNGNVIVDFATTRLPTSIKSILDAIGCLILALAAGLLTWRLGLGGLDLHRYNDQTMVLQIPTWIAFMAIVPSFALLSLAGLYTAVQSFLWRLDPEKEL